MQLREARMESSRMLALDAIDAEEDDETGAERRRNAEHGQNKTGTLSQYWDKCPNIGTLRKQVCLINLVQPLVDVSGTPRPGVRTWSASQLRPGSWLLTCALGRR